MSKWVLAVLGIMWAGVVVAAPEQVVLDAENMTCPACSITIEKALEKVSGVTDTQVDTEAGTVTVTFDSERTSIPAIADAVTNAGFAAKARTNGD
ncbi:heavy-metal-associated domain-containing protein [Luteimonas soli]|uniref:Heavy-metal-associated domain-containing protein n=1 Tax=Luteimonas soli TaxID=1648966 RepID=A0ABV7XJL6_9GAMM